jgi:hypothetical protein
VTRWVCEKIAQSEAQFIFCPNFPGIYTEYRMYVKCRNSTVTYLILFVFAVAMCSWVVRLNTEKGRGC